jgi:thiamine biosynthesis lipoprotein
MIPNKPRIPFSDALDATTDRLLLSALLPLLLMACAPDQPPRHHLSGSTMGTSFTVTYYGGPREQAVRAKLKERFESIDRQLSNWDPDSWVRRFNDQDTHTPMKMPHHVETVLRQTLRLSEQTGGALDPTLGRPINMWGFGPFEHERPINQEQLQNALQSTGTDQLILENNPPTLSKTHPELRLNFSATAKGYTIDRVATMLEEHGVADYKINIGGDLRTAGTPPGNDAWRILIQKSSEKKRGPSDQPTTLQLNNRSVATSGDYQRYIQVNGEKRPHILDPETAAPVDTSLASVSVVADTALKADGLATACFVLGEQTARKRLSGMKNVGVLFIHRTPEDGFSIRTSEGWPE